MMAAIARDDSVEPRMESSADKRFWDMADRETSVVDETRNPADAKKDADVMVECKTAN